MARTSASERACHGHFREDIRGTWAVDQPAWAEAAKDGLFRSGIDPVQLNITIAAVGYYYLTNRFTGSIIYERDLMAKDVFEERIRFNIETIMRLVCL